MKGSTLLFMISCAASLLNFFNSFSNGSHIHLLIAVICLITAICIVLKPNTIISLFLLFQLLYFNVGYYLYERNATFNSELIILFVVAYILTLTLSFALPSYKHSKPIASTFNNGNLAMIVAFVLFLTVYFFYGALLINSDRTQLQSSVGAASLFYKGIALACLLHSYNKNFLYAHITLLLICAVFAIVTLSRSQALQPLIIFAFMRYKFNLPKTAVLFLGVISLGALYVMSSLRSIEQDILATTFYYTITDPYAMHVFYAEGQSPIYGQYIVEYLYRLIPRAVWFDKPETIGFGKFVEMNDKARTPGIVVEGFVNFHYFGAILLMPVYALFYYYVGKGAAKADQMRITSLISLLFVGDILTSGRSIFFKVPYQIVEYAIVATICIFSLMCWKSVRRILLVKVNGATK